MKILNLYCSCSGNTRKVAQQIEKTAKTQNHDVDTIEITKDSSENDFDFLDYDFVFMGTGVYSWMPPKFMISFVEKLNKKHSQKGDVKMCSPRIAGKKAVVYCTYGGPHTGINEAVVAPKFMGQLIDHLGFEILDEWHFVGEFHGENFTKFSKGGRLGDITGRPNEQDLKNIDGLVQGILGV